MTNSVAVIIPACLQVQEILNKLCANIRTFPGRDIAQIILLCNRLSLMSPESLRILLSRVATCPVRVICDAERSVAGAWNRGIQLAMADGLESFLITAVDVAFSQNTLCELIRFGEMHPDVSVWSSSTEACDNSINTECVDGCDFSCVMLRQSTVDMFGWFDKEYKPAYFEDNDYVTRVVVGGGSAKKVVRARHIHEGSLTIKADHEMAHHVAHWYGTNEARFMAKWGHKTDDSEEIRSMCYKSPYNSGKPLSWWPEQDRAGYSVSGGMHE